MKLFTDSPSPKDTLVDRIQLSLQDGFFGCEFEEAGEAGAIRDAGVQN
jgi:hypothetical protein